MKTVIITGATGQDGSYMAEYLCDKGYRVIGAVRDVKKSEKSLPKILKNKIELVEWNMQDQQLMIKVLKYYRPDEIYNFAAYSSGAGMFDDPIAIGDVNGLAVTRILEAIREVDSNIRFCQASSSELFGEATEVPQSETTVFSPRSPYGAAKLYAHSMINIYRKSYGLFACSAILYNHESPKRGLEFVTRKITHEVAKIKLGMSTTLSLGNLEACRDWGFAGDYVLAMWKMLQMSKADDYVIASGKVHSVRELCEIAFEHVELNYKDYVREDVNVFRPTESFQLAGDASKAEKHLNWVPKIGFREIIGIMIDADLLLLQEKK